MILQHLYQPTERSSVTNTNTGNNDYGDGDLQFEKDVGHKKSQSSRLGGFIPERKPRKLVETRS